MVADFISSIIDNITSDLYEKIKNNTLNSRFFSKLTNPLNINYPMNDVNSLLKSAVNNIFKTEYYKSLDEKTIKYLFIDNEDLILSWVIDDESFDSSLLALQGDDERKICISFMLSLFTFIKQERGNYTNVRIESANKKLDIIVHDTDEIKTKLNLALPQLDKITLNTNWHFSKELNSIEELINSYNLNDAIKQLSILEDSIIKADNKDEIEKFYQLYSNAYLKNIDTKEKAIPYLEKLINNTEDLFLRKYRRILLKQTENKLDEVKQLLSEIDTKSLNKKELNLYLSVKIDFLFFQNNYTELETLLIDNQESIDNRNFYLIQLYLVQGLYDKAFNTYSEVGLGNKSFERVLKVYVQVFYYLTNETFQNENDSELKDGKLNSLLEECEELLALVKDDTYSLKMLLLFKIMILQDLRKIEEAFQVCESLAIFKDYREANFLRIYAYLLANKREYKKSLFFVEEYKRLYTLDIPLQQLYFSNLIEIDPCKAEQELQGYVETEDTLKIKVNIINSQIKQNKIKTAKNTLEELKKKYPDNYLLDYQEAFIKGLTREYNDAFILLTKVLDNNPDTTTFYCALKKIFMLGLDRKNYDYLRTAVSKINNCKNYEVLSYMGNEIIAALLNLKQYEEAYSYIKLCRNFGLVDSDLIRFELYCNYETENYNDSVNLYEELQESGYLTIRDQYIYMESLSRLGKEEELNEYIDMIPPPEKEDELFVFVYNLLELSKYKEAIKIVSQAFERNPDNLNIMELFMQLVMMHGNKDIMDDDILESYQKCLRLHSLNSSDKKRIKEISIPSNADGAEILSLIDAALPKRNKIDYANFLNENHFHISFLSCEFNYLFLWYNVKELDRYRIFISDCSQQDLQNEINAITKNDVIIDFPSLVSCAYLDILTEVSEYFNKIYISQNTISKLEDAKSSQNNRLMVDCTSGVYELNNYSYPKNKIDYSLLNEYIKRIDRFLSKNNVIKVGKQLDPKRAFPERFKESLFHLNMLEYSDIEYSYTSNIQLMIESWHVRQVLKEINFDGIPFTVETLLRKLAIEKIITNKKYYESIKDLLKANYSCICFDVGLIIYFVKKNNYVMNDEVAFLINIISSEQYSLESILLLLTDFLAISFKSNITELNLKFCLQFVLGVLKTRGDCDKMDIYHFFLMIYQLVSLDEQKQFIYDFWEEHKGEL